jgi:adenylate kinase family enzyme
LNAEKRICVVGASCVGKSTLLSYLPEAIDMDDLLFGNKLKGIEPLLTQQERDYVCGPWTPEVGQSMTKKARELIKIKAGHPVFGTIVFPSDLVIEITVPDDVLQERISRRNTNGQDVFNMKAQIESEIEKSGIEKIVIENI